MVRIHLDALQIRLSFFLSYRKQGLDFDTENLPSRSGKSSQKGQKFFVSSCL